MIYADLPVGATVFVDASPFIHHFEPNALFGPAATDFLERIENQEINGVTTTHMFRRFPPPDRAEPPRHFTGYVRPHL